MKNVKKHVVPIFSLFIYEICYFIFASYPKNLFDIRLINSAYQYIPDLITKLALLIIYICIITLICKYIFFNERYLLISEFLKHLLICIVFMLPVRLITDIIVWFIPSLKYTYAVQFITDILFNTVLFIRVFKQNGFYSQKIKFNKMTVRLIFAMCLITVLYVIISIFKVTQSIEFINYTSKKYSEISIQNDIMNYSFEISLYTLIFNMLSIVTLYFAFYNVIVEVKSTNISKGKITARIISIIIVFSLLFMIKAFLMPKNLLHRVIIEDSETINYQQSKKYDKNEKTLEIYRSNGYYEDTLVYKKSTIYITYGNKTIAKVHNVDINSDEKINDHGDGIYSYGTAAIMYTENNTPVCILLQDISNKKKNQKFTQVMEKLIDEGYFDFLEFSYDYMLKYDKEYLKPILKMYSQGVFNKEKNKNIKREYIVEFSKNALKNDFVE